MGGGSHSPYGSSVGSFKGMSGGEPWIGPPLGLKTGLTVGHRPEIVEPPKPLGAPPVSPLRPAPRGYSGGGGGRREPRQPKVPFNTHRGGGGGEGMLSEGQFKNMFPDRTGDEAKGGAGGATAAPAGPSGPPTAPSGALLPTGPRGLPPGAMGALGRGVGGASPLASAIATARAGLVHV